MKTSVKYYKHVTEILHSCTIFGSRTNVLCNKTVSDEIEVNYNQGDRC
jgi:hypothetical protein